MRGQGRRFKQLLIAVLLEAYAEETGQGDRARHVRNICGGPRTPQRTQDDRVLAFFRLTNVTRWKW